jgi:hypothetical protein
MSTLTDHQSYEGEKALQDEGEKVLFDARWDLVQRVAFSSVFQKTRRLRELLLFVCERALRDPEHTINEHEIGTAVFGKSADFDTSQDTLVRVQVSQLRKRLEQYFSTEGAYEALIIEIPKGAYIPIFRERYSDQETQPDNQTLALNPPRGLSRLASFKKISFRDPMVISTGLCVLLLFFSGWLMLENRRLHRDRRAGLEPRPTVESLWSQMFGNGQHTYLVLADSNLTLYQDFIQLQLTTVQYQRRQFKQLAESRITDPDTVEFCRRLMNRQFTGIADANLIRRISLLNAAYGIQTDAITARDADPRHFKSHNAIISGPRRANPWLELFEGQLNFQSRFEEHPRRLAYFENIAPLPGEESRYVVKWDHLGYCRVAYLPNLDATGSILLISGTDLSSTDAGAEFITSERWVRHLRSILKLPDGQPVPHFEVLLRAQIVPGMAPNFEMVTHRLPK